MVFRQVPNGFKVELAFEEVKYERNSNEEVWVEKR